MSNWEQAWEREKQRVGAEVHEGWAQEKISQGFADHPFTYGPDQFCERRCGISHHLHHTDMLPFAELPENIQAYDMVTGRVAFKAGFEAGLESLSKCIVRCPVCEGRGNVPGGFYTRGGLADHTGPDLCQTCGGAGILKVSTMGAVAKVVP